MLEENASEMGLKRWQLWGVEANEDSLRIATPWFALVIADKAKDWLTLSFWSGINVYVYVQGDIEYGETYRWVWGYEFFRMTRERYREKGGFG